jgi:tetratricopeptide (TPR) repeat protein
VKEGGRYKNGENKRKILESADEGRYNKYPRNRRRKMKNTTRTAIGVTLIVLIGLTAWALAGTLENQKYIDLGGAEFQKGNYDAAISIFTTGIELKPDNAYIYNDRGLSYLQAGDKDKAISDFTKAIELKPDFAEAYYNRGLAYFGSYKWWMDNKVVLDKAISDYTKVIELKQDYVDAYYNRGLVRWRQYGVQPYDRPYDAETIDRHNKALADFDKVLELDPMYVLAYAGKGNANYRYGEYDKALIEYGKALKSENLIIQKVGDEGLAGVYASRGRTYLFLEEMDKSISDYNKAMELLGKPPGHLSSIYQRLKEYNKAIDLIDRTIELKKDDPTYRTTAHGLYEKYSAKGDCYYGLKQYDVAIENYKKAIEIKPDDVSSNKGLGIAYLAIGEEEKARTAFERVIELCNGAIESAKAKGNARKEFTAYNDRGLTYYELGEYDKAISDFDKIIEMKSKSNRISGHTNYYIEAHKNLGLVYSKLGDKEKAKEYFEKAIGIAKEQGLKQTAKEMEELLNRL